MLRVASFLAEAARPTYARIAAYLGDRLGIPAELRPGKPWDALDEGQIDVAFLCGLPYSERHDRPGRPVELLCAPVMAAPRYGGRPIYFTDVVVRRDHPARAFADLRGATWAYNDDGSHSGYNVVRHHLVALGETHGFFGRTVATGQHQISIQLVLDGEIDASGIDSTVLDIETARRPELDQDLRTLATIGPSPIPPVVVARRLDAARRTRLRDAFLAMAADPAGRAILAAGRMAGFVPVEDADYDPIRAMVRRAEAAGFLTLR